MSINDHTNPFVGLRPFESDESLLFFGRQEQTMELLQRLHEHHFVAIIGNSGCGKSSLIRGGLIPRLKAGYLVNDRDRWMIVMMKPGQSPLHNLVAVILNQLKKESDDHSVLRLVEKIREEGGDALLEILRPIWAEQNTNFFLLVDQFEELFRFSMDQKEVEKKDEAIDFVNIMLELSRQSTLPIYVVMTMRSDFIGDCAKFFGLPEAMNRSQYLVPRLNRVQLKNAIEGPIKLFGSTIHASLTSRLLNDAGIIKDELPLLQHALMRIWDNKINADESRELDLGDYENIGGIEMALSYHADEALEGMSEAELTLTKQIFQALIVTDESGRKIRRPVLISQLEAITTKDRGQLMAIINRFSEEKRSFLIVSKPANSNEELVDISHESLIRQWGALSEWSDEELESSKIYQRLNESAQLYRDKKKDLLKGSEFLTAMQWYEKFNPSTVWARRYNNGFEESIDYLLKSNKEQKLAELKNKKVKRNKLVLTFSSVLFFGVAISFFLLRQRSESLRQNLNVINDALRLHSLALEEAESNPTVALRIEDAALQVFSDQLIKRTMQQLYRGNAFYKTIVSDSFTIPSIDVAQDGKSFLTGSYGKRACLWNMNGQLIAEFRGHRDSVGTAVFSPDGKNVLTSSRDSTAKLWDLNGKLVKEFKDPGGKLFAAIFSPDGSKILTGARDGVARLWNLDGNILKEFKGHTESIRSLCFSKDGNNILTGSDDHSGRLWDIRGGLLAEFKGHSNWITMIRFSPDDKNVVTSSWDWTARLWDLHGNLLKEFKGHGQPVYAVAFSPDGTKILTGAFDNTARLWDLEGNTLQEFKGHQQVVRAVAFLPGGVRIMTAGSDRTVRFWYQGNNLIREFHGYKDSVNVVSFSRDGSRVFISSKERNDSAALLWNINGAVERRFKTYEDRINAASFSADGTEIFLAAGNTFELRDLETKLIRVYKGHTGKINSIAISPDGTRVLTGSSDSTARLWNIAGNLLAKFDVKEKVLVATFSNDGSKILTATDRLTMAIWNINGQLTRAIKLNDEEAFPGHSFTSDSTCIAFSPDATKVLVSSNRDSIARIWSLTENKGLLATLQGHRKAVLSAVFSPDGTKVVTGSEDYLARVWDLEGRLLMELKGHKECIVALAFSSDGMKILTGSEDHTARLWNYLPVEDFLKTNLVDPLSEEQKRVFGISK